MHLWLPQISFLIVEVLIHADFHQLHRACKHWARRSILIFRATLESKITISINFYRFCFKVVFVVAHSPEYHVNLRDIGPDDISVVKCEGNTRFKMDELDSLKWTRKFPLKITIPMQCIIVDIPTQWVHPRNHNRPGENMVNGNQQWEMEGNYSR